MPRVSRPEAESEVRSRSGTEHRAESNHQGHVYSLHSTEKSLVTSSHCVSWEAPEHISQGGGLGYISALTGTPNQYGIKGRSAPARTASSFWLRAPDSARLFLTDASRSEFHQSPTPTGNTIPQALSSQATHCLTQIHRFSWIQFYTSHYSWDSNWNSTTLSLNQKEQTLQSRIARGRHHFESQVEFPPSA